MKFESLVQRILENNTTPCPSTKGEKCTKKGCTCKACNEAALKESTKPDVGWLIRKAFTHQAPPPPMTYDQSRRALDQGRAAAGATTPKKLSDQERRAQATAEIDELVKSGAVTPEEVRTAIQHTAAHYPEVTRRFKGDTSTLADDFENLRTKYQA